MAYNIVFMNGETRIGSTPWPNDYQSAVEHAKDHFVIHEKNSGATRVEVLDDKGKVVFSYPEGIKHA